VQNAAVDASNRRLPSSSKEAAVQIAWLRHMACELLHAVPAGLLQEFQLQQLINFCLKVSSAQLDIVSPSPPCPVLPGIHIHHPVSLACSGSHALQQTLVLTPCQFHLGQQHIQTSFG
jgi:hypothetical protein